MTTLKLSLAAALVALAIAPAARAGTLAPAPAGERVTPLGPALTKRAAAADDEFYARQWSLPAIGAPGAWAVTTGSQDVKVAVVDSGVNLAGPDLAPNLWHNPGESGDGREHNGVDDDGDGYVDDWRGWDFVGQDNDPSDNWGHGTHVAGTIAARGGDGVGVAGVAWHATLIPVRALDNSGRGTCETLTAGLAYAVRAGARVVNASFGGRNPCPPERAVIDGAPDTLFVVAAMNDGADADATPVYPCDFPSPNLICVAATDPQDRLAPFSNYGARNVDLAAPGVGVLSTYLKWGPPQTLLTDGFEQPLDGRWVTGGSPDTWTRTPFMPLHSGGFSLATSLLGGYANNADGWARLAGLDLRGERNCTAGVWGDYSLGPLDPGRPLLEQDRLLAETSPDGVHWTLQNGFVGTGTGFQSLPVDLSLLEGRATGGLRFRLVTDGSGTFKGVALDDLSVTCTPPLAQYTGVHDEYAFYDGTSMAAPHVSGVAALLLSLDPSLTAAQLEQRILAAVDPVPGLAGKTVTGGRLNAARALATPPPPAAAPPAPPAAPAPAAPAPAGPTRAQMDAVLAAQAKAIAATLHTLQARRLLARGGLLGVRGFAPAAGRLTLKLAHRRTLAAGSCAVAQAGRCRLDARLTRRGRALLRRGRRPRIAVVLAFAPRSGPPIVHRKTVTLNGGSK